MTVPVRVRHGVRIVWDVPAHVAAELTPHVARCDWLVPSWCHELMFVWRDEPREDDPGVLMQVLWDTGYRSAEIYVYPPFMAVDPVKRWRTVLHEFCHLPMCGVYTLFYDVTTALGGELEDVFNTRFRRELEGSTQDFARAIEHKCAPGVLADRAP